MLQIVCQHLVQHPLALSEGIEPKRHVVGLTLTARALVARIKSELVLDQLFNLSFSDRSFEAVTKNELLSDQLR